MPKRTISRVPSLRKCNNRGFVELNGTRHYLGPWDSPDTRKAYERRIAEWLSNNRLPVVDQHELTVTELCRDYWFYADSYYRDASGAPTSTADSIRYVLSYLTDIYGDTKGTDFGPVSLRTLRNVWVKENLSRRTVEYYVSLVKRCFKWAVANEKLPVTVYQSLATLEPLKKNRSEVRETNPIEPVLESHIYPVKPYVSSQVWALIQLQLLTGTRAGELLKLRPCDLDVSGKVWTTKLKDHKTSYRGKARTIYFGPNAQDILKTFMASKGIQDYLFSPKDAEAERHAKADTHRRPKQKKSPVKTDRTLSDYYTTDSYRRAITRACEKAGVPAWTPHRLRHNAATHIRKEYGLESLSPHSWP